MRIGLVSILLAASLCTFLPPWRTTAQSANHPTNDNLSKPTPSFAEKYWLAGRYDGNRVIIYFYSSNFSGDASSFGRAIVGPVIEAFFDPFEITTRFLDQVKAPEGAEHFAIGDRYDVLLGNGTIATVRLTELVAEQADIDANVYVGALGTEEKANSLIFTRNYYVARRHHDAFPAGAGASKSAHTEAENAKLISDPVRFDLQSKIADLLNQQMQAVATEKERRLAAGVVPAIAIQPIELADSSIRYYAGAQWISGRETIRENPFVLGVWVNPKPEPHVVAIEERTSGNGGGIEGSLPEIKNVVSLGNGKTGMIVQIAGDDSTELDLVEYRDGASLKQMPQYQSVGAGA